MKRISAILCAVSLLITMFAACSDPGTPSSVTTTAQTEDAQTAVPTTSTAAPTAPRIDDASSEDMDDDWLDTLEDLPTPTESPVTEPPVTEPLVVGPVHVLTDYSAYTPYAGSGAKYTRLREGPLDHFEPSDDYGGVYPYKAAQLVDSDSSGHSWDGVSMYGIVDRNGRILTDGIYQTVYAMRIGDDYSDSDPGYQPFWITERYENPVIHEEEEWLNNHMNNVELDIHCGVISMDGSFALPDVYSRIEALSMGFCCYRAGIVEVYDDRGERRFDLKNIPEAGVSLAYGDGLYLLSVYYPGEEYSRSTEEHWFLDEKGKRVLGPYADANCFSEGLAWVALEQGRYCFIDKKGNPVFDGIEGDRNGGTAFQNGMAIIFVSWNEAERRVILIDRAGNLILECSKSLDRYDAECGFMLHDFDSSTEYFYDMNGQLLVSGANVDCLDADTFVEYNSGSIRIFRLNGEEIVSDVSMYLDSAVILLEGKVTIGYLGDTAEDANGKRHFYFVPRDLSAVIPFDAEQAAYPGNWNYYDLYFRNAKIWDPAVGRSFLKIWDKDAWVIADDTEIYARIPVKTKNFNLWGDRVRYVTEQASVMTDLEGNVIFFYPLNAED
ncbi:MAG: hypothetical protein IKS05_08370 [Oscillospiraceae bacterium]|nr:hypothetical protein [Oscillospiraceae bacterium]